MTVSVRKNLKVGELDLPHAEFSAICGVGDDTIESTNLRSSKIIVNERKKRRMIVKAIRTSMNGLHTESFEVIGC
jgi:hypothetical protein